MLLKSQLLELVKLLPTRFHLSLLVFTTSAIMELYFLDKQKLKMVNVVPLFQKKFLHSLHALITQWFGRALGRLN